MGVQSKRLIKKADKIQKCPTLSNHFTENMMTRRRLVNDTEKDQHTKKEDQANRQLKIFQKEEPVRTHKDSSTPSVKYTNRKYKKCGARKDCNQGLESFKSEFEVLKECGCGYLGP